MYTCTYPRRIQKPLHRLLFAAGLLVSSTAFAVPFVFSTGTVTNSIATASRPGPGSGANQETESADDFLLGTSTQINSATFTGLLPAGVNATTDISQVVIEIYRVFPNDSDTTRTGFPVTPFSTSQVPARQNSPSDVEFTDRDSAAAKLTFSTTALPTFTGASNSVDLGIHPKPGFNTGGDGPVSGMQEVQFNVTFSDPIDLPAGHYFFVPQVLLSDPDEHFLWLSASRPIDATGTPFAPDLQSWIRNASLDPDWLRIGTDIVGGTTFNAAFTLAGETIPEPATLALLCVAFAGIGVARRRTQH